MLQKDAVSYSLPARREQELTQRYALPPAWREVHGGPRLEGEIPLGSATALQVHYAEGNGPIYFTFQNFTEKM